MALEIIHTDDGSPTLLNKNLNASYHSTYGALQESRHIYIEGGLHYAQKVYGNKLTVLEIGFGTGLNTLLTYGESLNHGLEIQYTTIEKYPLNMDLVSKLEYPDLTGLDADIFRAMHRAEWNKSTALSEVFTLTKYLTDIQNMMFLGDIHLVYYDAFAPTTSPDMWDTGIFKRLYEAMLPRACLVTFCAKGEIKRNFKQCGFMVEALPGPKDKREMIRVIK